MNASRQYANVFSLISAPAFLLALVFGLPAVAVAALVLLIITAIVFPAEMKTGVSQGLQGLLLMGLFGLTLGFIALGVGLFVVGLLTGALWIVLLGAMTGIAGTGMTKSAFVRFLVPKPIPEPISPPTPAFLTPPKAEVQTVDAEPEPEVPLPPPVPMPRETVMLGGRYFPAYSTDEGSYAISGPPGVGKTTQVRMMLRPIIDEVLDPRCHSTLVVIDPKREMHAWIASIWPQDSLVPFELFCPSDTDTVTLDWDFDFSSPTHWETCSLALFPANPFETQPFFGNAARAVVEASITAIKSRLGTWDLRLLMLVLSNPGYMKQLIGSEKTAKFAAELLSGKSETTAQNVQMEITSRISKWRKVAAHLSHVDSRRKKFSLERFLGRPGVLVIQKDDNHKEQHNAMNAMLLQRMGQILKEFPEDPNRERKVYIVIDEFPSLGCIEDFDSMCRELRSRGVSIIAIWQSWANIVDVWKQKADTLQGALQNWLILGSADITDAKHSAELIGKARGFEAQHSSSSSKGTSKQQTVGGGSSGSKSTSGTRAASGIHSPGFTPTSTSGSTDGSSTSYSRATGDSEQMTTGVNWVYYERDIKSPTELMRNPRPSDEGGFRGIAYRAGERCPWEYFYENEFVDSLVHRKNRFIPDYRKWPEKYQILEELTPRELRRLGLEESSPEEPDLYPTQEEARERFGSQWEANAQLKQSGNQLPSIEDGDDGDWDAE